MPSLPAQPRLTVPLEVYYFDTDAGGVVHNIAYLRMVEIARSQLAASLGWTLEDMGRTGLVPVVARTEIDYLKPARLGDALVIEAELAGLEKVRMYMRFDIRSARVPKRSSSAAPRQWSLSNCPAAALNVFPKPGERPIRNWQNNPNVAAVYDRRTFASRILLPSAGPLRRSCLLIPAP
jgi:YbgC/YbaW family acyl-CoA thioester hydrolase